MRWIVYISVVFTIVGALIGGPVKCVDPTSTYTICSYPVKRLMNNQNKACQMSLKLLYLQKEGTGTIKEELIELLTPTYYKERRLQDGYSEEGL